LQSENILYLVTKLQGFEISSSIFFFVSEKSKFWQKTKFCPKIQIFPKIQILAKIKILTRNINFGQKYKFREKIEILETKNRNFAQKKNCTRRFCPKIETPSYIMLLTQSSEMEITFSRWWLHVTKALHPTSATASPSAIVFLAPHCDQTHFVCLPNIWRVCHDGHRSDSTP